MAQFSATPYAYGGPFFYFSSEKEYKEKYKKNIDKDTGLPYEEYEIDFQDGDDHEYAIYKLMSSSSYGLPQGDIGNYFATVNNTDSDDVPAILYLADRGVNVPEAIANAENVMMREGRAKDVVWEYIDDIGGTEQLGDRLLEQYFDYDSFGRDVRIEGNMDPINDEDQYPVQEKPKKSDYDDEDDFEEAQEQFEEFQEAEQAYDRQTDQELGEYVVHDIYGSVAELAASVQQNYFDHDSFARDLVLGGDWDEFEDAGGKTWTIINATEF